MNWTLIVLLAVAGFLLIRYGKGLLAAIGKLMKDNAVVFATVIVVFIVALLVIVMFQPQVLVGPSGVFGSALKGAKAEANLKTAVLDPRDNPDVWSNRGLAQRVAIEYQLATARNQAEISVAEADRLSHLPKGHPDRALWDKVGMDPAAGSLPPAVQVSKNTIGEIAKNAGDELHKIDLNATEASLSKPLGMAPTGAEQWIRSLYDLPKGFVLSIGLILAILVVGLAFSKFARSVLRP